MKNEPVLLDEDGLDTVLCEVWTSDEITDSCSFFQAKLLQTDHARFKTRLSLVGET